MTKRKIQDAVLLSKWSIVPERAMKECHLYICIAPNGIPEDLFMLDKLVEISFTDSAHFTYRKERQLIKKNYQEMTDALWEDWKKGNITRRVLSFSPSSWETRTLIPNSRTTFLTEIPKGWEEYLMRYKK